MVAVSFGAACGSSGGSGSVDGGDGGGGELQDGSHGKRDATMGPEGGHRLGPPHVEAGSDACTNGSDCGDGGVCTGGSCCPSVRACGSACCGEGAVCSFGACVQPGASCVDSTDCSAGEYCQYALAAASSDAGVDAAADGAIRGDASTCVGGVVLPHGVCLPAPPTCGPDAGAGAGISCIESCQYHPEAGTFAPALRYSWGGQITAPTATDVMMAPVVVPLLDTNCDGKVNAEDIPDIIFTTFSGGVYNHSGTLHAIHVKGGALAEDWNVPPQEFGTSGTLSPGLQLAAGDLDGLPGAEIVGCLVPDPPAGDSVNEYTASDGVVAFHADGTLYWVANGVDCYMPSIADLDQDGHPEVITEGGILNGQTGAITPYTNAMGAVVADIGFVVPTDIDGDGLLDLVSGEGAFHKDGTQFVATGGGGGFVAVGDLDKDGIPEVVVTGDTVISIWHYESTAPYFAWVRQDLSTSIVVPGGACASTGGGPPTIADFNGDGYPDVALAGSINYTVFDGYKLMNAAATVDGGVQPGAPFFLWTYSPTDDCSSAETGSTVFDFTGSGIAEVLYSDQQELRVFNGPDGGVLWQTCNTTGTLVEYPLVADVDNDGHADIIVVSNAYAIGDLTVACQETAGGPMGESGVRVFSDPNLAWVRTRALWNEHPYHITNVNDDGTIPAKELPNWTQPGLNDFRQNKQPGDVFAAADAIVAVAPSCGQPPTLVATVRNIGEAALPAGVLVDFYSGSPGSGTLVGSTTTDVALYSAQSETLTLVLAGTAEATSFYAIVDPPNAPPHPAWHECRTDNNTSTTAPVMKTCGSGPK